MRDLKFRQWHDGNMYYWGFGVNGDGSYFSGPVSGTNCRPDVTPQMQYTGLHDKNGKEIYEGDILKTPTGVGAIGYVLFVSGEFIVAHPSGMINQISHRGGGFIIIGNIHENPELLEDK